MTKKLYWTLSALAIVIIGFVAFQVYLYIDFKNFKNESIEHTPVQIGESSNETSGVTPSQKTVFIHENNPERNKPRYTGEATYEAYEKYVTEAWKNYEHNRMSPFPASPVGIPFRTIEEDEKASELWHKLVNEDSERIIKEINNE